MFRVEMDHSDSTDVSLNRADYGSTTCPNSSDTFQTDEIIPQENRRVRSDFLQSVINRFSLHSSGYSKFNSRLSKMSYDNAMPVTVVNSKSFLQTVEIYLSILNQICIGFVTIYMSWMCLRTGLAGTGLHAWLVTIGFSLLMAEGMMCHYGLNVLTSNYKRNTKTTIHWILMAFGGGCGVAGILIKCIQKGFLLHSTHGKLGFSTFILCLVNLLSGVAALFSVRVKKILSPLLNKTFHNFLGVATFTIALVTQFYGYQTGYFLRRADSDFRKLIECITLISLVLTNIGPLKALFQKICNIFRKYG